MYARFSPLGADPGSPAEILRGWLDLPAGSVYDEGTRTVYRQKFGQLQKDDYATARARAVLDSQASYEESRRRQTLIAMELALKNNLSPQSAGLRFGWSDAVIQEYMLLWDDKQARERAATVPAVTYSPAPSAYAPAAAQVYSPAPASYAPAATYQAPAVYQPTSAVPAIDPAAAERAQAAMLAAQAAEIVRNYAGYPASIRAYASQLVAAGRSGEAGPWLDYAAQVEQWISNLRRTYNVA